MHFLPLMAAVAMALQSFPPGGQEGPRGAGAAQAEASPPAKPPGLSVEWREGLPIRVRVPVASASHQLMTTVAFPEETIEAAITGWGESDITAVQKRGLLFLRLAKKSEGQLNVLGGSGTHYLLYLTGVDDPASGAYDTYVRIRRDAVRAADPLPRPKEKRPTGSLELLQAMRLGLRPEGGKILRANRELAYESQAIEIRLLYVYDTGSYSGHVYEVTNRTGVRQAVDASRFRAKESRLILSGLRENLLEPKAATRLYSVFWKE